MPIRSAVKNLGSADGSRTYRKTWRRVAPMLRISAPASRSVAANPSIRPIATGKNVTRAMTSTFGSRPKPNQMIISGAIAMIGRVWEATNNGTNARRSAGEKSTTMASSQARTNETVNPIRVTCSVAAACTPISARCDQPCATTRDGDGSTCGRIPLTST